MLKQIIIPLVATLSLTLGATESEMLYSFRFKDGAEGWLSTGKAVVSDKTRLPGAKSLRLLRENETDDATTTSWVSPVLSTGGKSVTVGFWAAENYQKCNDFSYSAAVLFESCAEDGTGAMRASNEIYFSWDVTQRGSWSWGKRLSDSLRWKYYSYTLPSSVKHFRIVYSWPKPLVRGSCYLTDVTVRVAKGSLDAAVKNDATQSENRVANEKKPFNMWLSAPATWHIFFEGDALRFDAAIYADGKKLDLPDGASIHYRVTDFNLTPLANGQFSLQDAKPIDDPAFYKNSIAKSRKITKDNFVVKRFVLPQGEVSDDGRLFFLTATVVAPDGTVLAQDTIPYGVVKKMTHPYKTQSDSRFYGWYWGEPYRDSGSVEKDNEQSLSIKHGMVRECQFYYGWKKDQPVYPGPINAGGKYSGKRLVTFMPNAEQINGSADIPEGAITKKLEGKHPWHGDKVEFNIDAYVAYIVEYVRANREYIDWVIPSGLERRTTPRTVELHKKAFTALKKEFPDVKVGYSVYMGSKEIESDGLHNYIDFITVHLYDSSINWSYKKELEAMYKRIGKPLPPLTNTEFAIVAGNDQVGQSMSAYHGIWEMIENNIVGMNAFATGSNGKKGEPFLTEAVGDSYVTYQRVNRPVIAPEAVNLKGKRVYIERPYMPVLKTMTYYNFVRDFDWTDFRKKIQVSENVTVYIFDRNDDANSARCGIRMKTGVADEVIRVLCDKSYIYKDMFGRKTRIVPVNGESFLTVTQNPATLIFDEKAEKIDFKMVATAEQILCAARGCTSTLSYDVPDGIGKVAKSAVLQAFGGNAFKIDGKLVAENGKMRVEAEVTLPANAASGSFPLRLLLKNAEGAVYAMLGGKFSVSDILGITLDASPSLSKAGPGMNVTLVNRGKETLGGTVVFKEKHLTEKLFPGDQKQSFSLTSGETTSVFFSIPEKLVDWNFNELATVQIVMNDGKTYAKDQTLFFRPCLYAEKELKIDGDLSDWPLDKLRPVVMERKNIQKEGERTNGEFYTMWRDDVLYMALKVKDATKIHLHSDIGLWVDDSIMTGIYPWRWKNGEPMHGSMYREHIGLHKDGTVGKYRAGTLNGGLNNMDIVKVAIKETPQGYIYEMAYPKASLMPLELKEGNGYRFSLVLTDCYSDENGKYIRAVSYFGGFVSSVDLQPSKWFEFIFVK